MKKLSFSLLTLVAINGLAQAVTVNAPASLVTGGLDGNQDDSWAVPITLSANQSVNTASITYTNIKLTATGSNDRIWTDLLNTNASSTALVTTSDADAAGDAWALIYTGGNYTNVGMQTFVLNQTFATLTYNITGSALAALNSYLTGSNHSFSIGMDPDCHYSLGGLTFNYTTATTPAPTVPDGGMTASLMVIGLAGLEILRRQSVSAKNKA